MESIQQKQAVDELPVGELQTGLERFLQTALRQMCEERLRTVGKLSVKGILGSQSPLVTPVARHVVRKEETLWPAAKRSDQFVWNVSGRSSLLH